ncbi:class I SAM-dependent methyltransferase [Actinoplanes sp. NEAU-A12]|uniref:Class I SAM-dependent methyltransferase n=1 Tax=Actinoplanes sandaracinus TaxID=3045177 RepID=A0ABT6WYJ9_9ACTN|nr:class I SAM-dependent methyltransferase [Actinoplanes sandaracinus]MDI6104835.1 class I SAM-dependent methyltransferase [Actinoplanes sandaracinus]
MNDFPIDIPAASERARKRAEAGGFKMSSDPRTGALLRTLAASKPGGNILEVGAGIGVGAGWLLDGMDADARLTSIEVYGRYAEVCRQMLAGDDRVEVVTADATEWLTGYDGPPFDLAFVDTTVTKFERRDTLYRNLADGAIVVADDLLPQNKWAAAHPDRVERFRKEIMTEPNLVPTLLDWASGLVIATYRTPRAAS